MRAFVMILLVVSLCGCAHRATEQHAFEQMVFERKPLIEAEKELKNVENIRSKEALKSYPMGRYVDPNDTGVMHEGHVVYRIEHESNWNLNPNVPTAVPMGDMVAIATPERKPEFSNVELESCYAQLSHVLKVLVENNSEVQSSILELQRELDTLKQQKKQKEERNER